MEATLSSLEGVTVCKTFLPNTSNIKISLSKLVLDVMYIFPLLTGFG